MDFLQHLSSSQLMNHNYHLLPINNGKEDLNIVNISHSHGYKNNEEHREVHKDLDNHNNITKIILGRNDLTGLTTTTNTFIQFISRNHIEIQLISNYKENTSQVYLKFIGRERNSVHINNVAIEYNKSYELKIDDEFSMFGVKNFFNYKLCKGLYNKIIKEINISRDESTEEYPSLGYNQNHINNQLSYNLDNTITLENNSLEDFINKSISYSNPIPNGKINQLNSPLVSTPKEYKLAFLSPYSSSNSNKRKNELSPYPCSQSEKKSSDDNYSRKKKEIIFDPLNDSNENKNCIDIDLVGKFKSSSSSSSSSSSNNNNNNVSISLIDYDTPPLESPISPIKNTMAVLSAEDHSTLTRNINSTKTLESLVSQTECSICYEIMAYAHSLSPCGDSFCYECIYSFSLACIKNKTTLNCPLCQSNYDMKFALPNRTIDNLIRELIKNEPDQFNEWETRVETGLNIKKQQIALSIDEKTDKKNNKNLYIPFLSQHIVTKPRKLNRNAPAVKAFAEMIATSATSRVLNTEILPVKPAVTTDAVIPNLNNNVENVVVDLTNKPVIAANPTSYKNTISVVYASNNRRICCVCNDYILSGTAKIVIESKQLFKVDVTNVICHLKCLHTYCSKGGDDRKFGKEKISGRDLLKKEDQIILDNSIKNSIT